MYNIYLDTETTDKIPGQIAELSMIIEDSTTNTLVGVRNYFFTVSEMSDEAEGVHGLSREYLNDMSGGDTFSDKHQEIHSILNGSRIIAHNEAFDERFISTELWRCGISFSPADRLCTMNYFKPIIKLPARYRKFGAYKNPKLSELLDFLNIDQNKVLEYCLKLFKTDLNNRSFHDSRFDTTAMYVAVNLYREMLHGGNIWTTAFTKD